jgi:tripartite-type tricarboxylate transporter receptor subunit TctC
MLITGALAQHVRDGRARGLATLLPARSKALPDLPTHAESGIAPFPGIPWMGLFGPAKLPKEIVDRLSKELLAALAKPEVRTQIERAAMDINPLSPEGMGALSRDQVAVWKRLFQEAGMTPE